MKGFLKIIPLIGLIACTSPAANMTQEQVSSLSNQQLCTLKNSYPWEQKTEIEIGRRNINCDPVFDTCLMKGIQPNTPAMGMCIENYQQQAAMEQALYTQQVQLEREASRNRLQEAADRAAMHNMAQQQQQQNYQMMQQIFK